MAFRAKRAWRESDGEHSIWPYTRSVTAVELRRSCLDSQVSDRPFSSAIRANVWRSVGVRGSPVGHLLLRDGSIHPDLDGSLVAWRQISPCFPAREARRTPSFHW